MAKRLSQVQAVSHEAEAVARDHQPVKNSDGTTTYQVMLGYTSGQIDLVQFFPDNLVVSPGDTVEWYYGGSDAPHTVTFLNGAPAPEFVLPIPQPSGPPLLLINPAVFFPSQLGQPLTREGIFSSGLLQPPGGSYSLTVGDVTGLIHYVCLLHDESGMEATLVVAPEKARSKVWGRRRCACSRSQGMDITPQRLP